MEIINQRIYTLDGVSACKAGEWPGNKSSHWNSSIKVLKPIQRKNRNFLDCKLNFKKTYSINNNLASLGGMRHFQLGSNESTEKDHRPGFRLFEPKIYDDATIKHGKKYIEPNYTEPMVYSANIKGINCITIKEDPIRNKKQFLNLIKDNRGEYGVDNLIGKKIRLPNIHLIRNGLPVHSPGDKIYGNVDYSPDFFLGGGLVPGSTNKIKYNKSSGKRGDLFYQSLDLNVKTLDKNKLWKDKFFQESLEFDYKYVGNLNIWEDEVLQLPKKVQVVITNNKKK